MEDDFPDLTQAQVVSAEPEYPDLSTAVPVADEIAQQSRDLINKHSAGEIDLTPEQLQKAIVSAQAGKGAWQRAGEWTSNLLDPLLNPITGAKMAYEGGKQILKQGVDAVKAVAPIFGSSPDASYDLPGFNESTPKDIEQQKLALETAKKLPAQVIAGTGRTGVSLATLAGGAFNEGADLLGLGSTENTAGLYNFQHDMNQAISEVTGVKSDDPVSQATELAEFGALPMGIESKLAPAVAKGAELAVEGGTKVIGKSISAAAKTGQAIGPAAVAAEAMYAGHPMIALGSLLAGYTPARFGWIGSIKHAIIDQGLGAIDTVGKAIAEAPWGVPVAKSVQDDLKVVAAKLESKIAEMRTEAGPSKLTRIDKLHPDGTPVYDLNELSAPEKEIRLNQDKLNNANLGIDKMDKYASANRILSDATKYVLQSAGNLGVAETTGAAFTSAGAAPGDTEAQRRGQEMGLVFGLPGLHNANIEGRNRMLRGEMIGKGKSLIPEESLQGLTPEQKDSVYAHAAQMEPLGGKIEIVSPDEVLARSSAMPPEEGAVAPNGFFDKKTNTLVINRDAIASGVIGHEFGHLADQQLDLANEKFSQDIQKRIDEGSEPYKQFADHYVERMKKSDPNFKDLTNTQVNEEVKAEISRLITMHMPPETFYGGKVGATIIKDWIAKKFGSGQNDIAGTVDGFGAPYTPADVQAIQDVFYDIGEKARSGEKFPAKTETPAPETTPPQGPPPDVMEGMKADAISALKQLKIADPKAKVESAINDMVQDGNSMFSTQEIVRRATQKAVPKPIGLESLAGVNLNPPATLSEPGQFMPATKSDTIDRPASKINDMIFPGVPSQAKRAAKKLGLEDLSDHVPGFVTVGGKFMSPEEARLHGEETGQLPESLKDQLTPQDLTDERRFMPSGPEDMSPEEFAGVRDAHSYNGKYILDGPAGDHEIDTQGQRKYYSTPELALKAAKRYQKELQGATEAPKNAPEASLARLDEPQGSTQPEADLKQYKRLNEDAGPSVDSPPWVHEYFALDQKDLNGTLTPEETKRMDELHQRAEKEYGSYDNFYKAHGGEQYNAEDVTGIHSDKMAQDLKKELESPQFMPSTPEEYQDLASKYKLAYNGVMGNDKTGLHLFTDPKTNSTIAIKQDASPEQLQKKILESRAKFAGGLDKLSFMPDKLGFYSKLEQTLEDKMPNRASVDQIRGLVKSGGVKADEIKWSGLDDFLAEKEKKGEPVTKQEALDYVRANNVQVQEVVKGDKPFDTQSEWLEATEEGGRPRWDLTDPTGEQSAPFAIVEQEGNGRWAIYRGDSGRRVGSSHDLHDAMNQANDYAPDSKYADGATKFSQYVTPGGEPGSYRELLLSLPPQPHSVEQWKVLRKDGHVDGTYTNREQAGYRAETIGGEVSQGEPVTDLTGGPENFHSSHFDEPNILAHVRFDTRLDPDGTKMLHIAEFQSDAAAAKRKGEDVSLPFIDSPAKWSGLAMRRMIRYAAENGFSKISWDNGETQADRYDLSKQIESVDWVKNKDGTYDVVAFPKGDNATGTVSRGDLTPKEISDFVGKEVADKITSGDFDKPWDQAPTQLAKGKLDNVDLKVSGEGMKAFYDKILPNVANDIGKKFGAKVGTTEINVPPKYGIEEYGGSYYVVDEAKLGDKKFDPEEDPYERETYDKKAAETYVEERNRLDPPPSTVHSMEIAPQMRESVMTKGQPMFQPSTGTTVPITPPKSTMASLPPIAAPTDQKRKPVKNATPGRTPKALEHRMKTFKSLADIE